MTQLLALPTRAEEDWRYSPKGVLAEVWPVAVEEIVVPAGTSDGLAIVQAGDVLAGGEQAVARQILLVLGDDATFDLTLLNLGGAYSRIGVEARLGRGARLTIGGVQLAGAQDVLEIVTTIVHAAPDASSRQTIRSVAAGQGSVTYLGKVRVERGADGTDGAQSVRAMLLSPTAQANARPELEIYADDVKCAHGCAVGQLDEQGLFYLASRGLPPAQARALMLQAFVAEALAGLEEGRGAGTHDAAQLRATVAARLQVLAEAGA